MFSGGGGVEKGALGMNGLPHSNSLNAGSENWGQSIKKPLFGKNIKKNFTCRKKSCITTIPHHLLNI